MPQVSLNDPAPDFTLESFNGQPFTLSERLGRKNILLVFNRTFQ